MTTVLYFYKTKSGEWREGESRFWDLGKAKRFLFGARRKGLKVREWSCDDGEAEELWRLGL